jgi:class 3 adenylate cyclase
LGTLSVFWHFVPGEYFTNSGVYYSLVTSVLMACAILFFAGCGLYVEKYATLPRAFPTILVVWLNSFGFILHPPAIEVVVANFGDMIVGDKKDDGTFQIVVGIITFVLMVAWLLLYSQILAPTLLFRPAPLVMVASEPANVFFIGQAAVCFLIGVGTFMPLVVRCIFLAMAALVYWGMLFATTYYGGFAVLLHSIAYQSSCVSGGAMCIANIYFLSSEQEATLPVFVCFLFVFAVAVVLTYVVRMHLKRKRLLLLDLILEDSSHLDDITSINQWVNCTIEGFRVGHPVCLDWTVFRWAVDQWPQSSIVWFIYAKFVCIFPEQSQTLAWIYRTVVTNKVKGLSVRVVKAQSLAIARQREATLGPELTGHLRRFAKQLASGKQKLRRVWDLAIQGNTIDMDDATKRALEAQDECDASMRHIYRQYPNNRFVTRQYARVAEELLADSVLAADMVEKSRLLQRSIQVNKDTAHEWGTHSFPNLPDKVAPDRGAAMQDSVSVGEVSETDQEVPQGPGSDGSALIAQQISQLAFPGFRRAILLQAGLFCAFVVIELPVLLIMSKVLQDEALYPLPFFNNQALYRLEMLIISGLVQQIVYTRLEETVSNSITYTPAPRPPSGNSEPVSFGGSWELDVMSTYWSRRLSRTLQDLSDFRGWSSGNSHVKAAQRVLFEAVHEFVIFDKDGNRSTILSLPAASVNVLTQEAIIVAKNVTTANDVGSPGFKNINYNVPILMPRVQDSIDELTLYVQEDNSAVSKKYSLIAMTSLGVGAVLMLGALYFEITWIRWNKEKVFTCLTSLPKTNVSQMAENLRVRKRENDDTSTSNSETNKQDDNIMKIFLAGGSSGVSNILAAVALAVFVICTIACFVVAMILLWRLILGQSESITASSPHMTLLLGAYAAAFQGMTDLLPMYFFGTPFQSVLWTKPVLVGRVDWLLADFRDLYIQVRFGNETSGLPPYAGYSEASQKAKEKLACADEHIIPSTLQEAARCFVPDMIYGSLQPILKARVGLYAGDPNQERLNDCNSTQGILTLLIYPIFELLIEPMYASIGDIVLQEVKDQENQGHPIIIALIFLGLFFEAAAILGILSMQSRLRRTLGLLLHCPASVILQTPKVMTVLSGDFAVRKRDEGARNAEFFREVVMEVPDAILSVDTNTGLIVSQNTAAQRIFGDTALGRSIDDFLDSHWSGQIDNIKAIRTDSKPVTESLVYEKDIGTSLNLDTTVHAMQEHVVYVFRDVTATVRYNSLIAGERAKSDALLKSILPPSLVSRVQAGEKNISFAVTSATIVFMDIVSFTPWCGSSTADKVMMTLNALFRKFDANCSAQSTMTRIKCIGDCYMAAGGVFSEVNQPMEHAKQVVQFGLDSLKSINELNEELNEHLQIRVGVNTGGPIIAGVLGGGAAKPTFEILGPSINMAQQMEHHGVPMQVHVSRSVYELIYGDQFVVKERGAIEVKGGTVVTYLVSEKEAPHT